MYPPRPSALAVLLLACTGAADPPSSAPDAAADAPAADAPAADVPACEPSAAQPAPRGDAAGAVDPATGDFYLIGGDVGPVESCMARPMFSNETWRFDARCGAWERLRPEAPPSARSRAAYALDARRRRLLVFGGRSRAGSTGAYTLYDELWSLDLAGGRWTVLSPEHAGPSARANATLVVDAAADAAILFGGNTSTDGARFTPRGDTWRLDLASLAWSRVASDRAPPAREFHASAARDGAVLVLGGGDANAFTGPFLRDAWRLDLAAGQWSPLALSGDAPGIQGRISHALAPRDGGWVVVGGHDDGALGNRNDVFAIADDGAVAERSAGDTLRTPGNGFCDFPADFAAVDVASPERRSAFVLAVDAPRQRAIVYGGKTDCGTAADLWSLDLRALTWTVLRAATDGLSCGRTGRERCRNLCG
jgi:hypothetical protein